MGTLFQGAVGSASGEPRALSDVGRCNGPYMECLEMAKLVDACKLLLGLSFLAQLSFICGIRSRFWGASKLTSISGEIAIF